MINMKENKYYLAIDLGASSGRHIIGWKENGEIKTKEIYRFENHMDNENGHLVWDTERLFSEIKSGIKVAFSQYKNIESLAIDTWGVDYVLIKDGKGVSPCYAYRDSRTANAIQEINSIIPFEKLYKRTGIQFQAFNTIYQLYADKTANRLEGVSTFLMMPEYFNYLLTGVAMKEYTNATTTGLVNCKTKKFDTDVIGSLGLPEQIFSSLHEAGTIVGKLKDDVATEVGGQTVVKLCPSHDTASAFYAVDNEKESALISSGTWAILGAKIEEANVSDEAVKCNFSNEGGVGNFRFLKNITGMWINVCLKKIFGKSFDEMTALAAESKFDGVFDVNDKEFSLPEKMDEKIARWFSDRNLEVPKTEGDLYRSAYRSMAMGYKKAVDELEKCENRSFDKIYIVGGGANNKLVNEFTREFTQKEIVAMPIEATAIGNIKSQTEI